MGGTPRRGLLFEGLPGTGKTMTAKAMAAEAGVPFLFVSATSFQSMYYGATAKKIRAYFKALRKAARTEGGAIGFIEEIDAIAIRPRRHVGRRGGHGPVRRLPRPARGDQRRDQRGHRRRRQRAARADAVVRRADGVATSSSTGSSPASTCCSRARQMRQRSRSRRRSCSSRPPTAPTPSTRPCCARAGSTAASPSRRPTRSAAGRSSTTSWHAGPRPELDDTALRDRLAAATNGWTPVMIEHLLDEALVNALRRGSMAMSYADIEHARITEMVGIGQPVRYTEAEQRLIATHEAGHAVTAWLAAPNRTLEVLTIIRRGDALGLLAHGDCEEVWTRSHYDLRALVQIAMGGWVAEELFFGQTSTGPAGDLASATRTAAQMVGAAGMTGSLDLVRRDAARPGLGGAQRRAGPRPAGGRPRRRPQHGPPPAVPQPAPGRGAAGRTPGAARAHRRRDHRRARGGAPGRSSELPPERERGREESSASGRRVPRRRLPSRRSAAAGRLAFGACPRVIPSTASPVSFAGPRRPATDRDLATGPVRGRRRADQRAGHGVRGRRGQAAVLHVRVR